MKLSEMNRDQRSLLLYLETCAVDHGGSVDAIHMNHEDFRQAEEWAASGFIEFGRIAFGAFPKQNGRERTSWVRFSDDAWRIAHEERRARCERLWSKRTWETTKERRAA